jgi:CRP-like cAMP-binding protein
MARRPSKSCYPETDLILSTTELPQNRTARCRELLRSALALTDDLSPKKTIFAQRDLSDAVFFREGKVKLTVVSEVGKEATIGILNEGAFFGEGCFTGQPLRLCTATRNDRLLCDANR